jgi:hypothetical protein
MLPLQSICMLLAVTVKHVVVANMLSFKTQLWVTVLPHTKLAVAPTHAGAAKANEMIVIIANNHLINMAIHLWL